jgi:hypothetical protein
MTKNSVTPHTHRQEATMHTFDTMTTFPITRSDLYLPEDEGWDMPDAGIKKLRAEHLHATLDAAEDGKVTLLVSGDPHGYLIEVDLEPAMARELADQLVRAAMSIADTTITTSIPAYGSGVRR